MTGNIEDDLFYDLFGEEGFLTPEESSGGSTDQDSGHGSPFDSNFETSPRPFGWETSDHVGEFWGSILDDLPEDITDDSDSNEYKSPLSSSSNDQDDVAWSTKVLEESSNFDCTSNNTMNVDSGWNLNENELLNVKDVVNFNCATPTVVDNNNISLNNFPLPIMTKPLQSADDAMNQNDVEPQPTQPIVIKPTAGKKGPTWVVKTSDIKSHFQIGQNIVAIIQSVNTNNLSDKTPINIESMCNDTTDLDKPSASPDYQGNMFSHVEHHIDHDYADTEKPEIKETMGVSKGMGPGLMLTDEEKKLLELESLKVPEDAPLTKEEEKVLKKVRRKIKNKQSAMESRRKRKEYIENLERRVKHCTDLNHGLRKKVDKLTKENKSLVSQLKTMKEFIAASFNQNRTASTGTCLAVLLLSFALFILPINPFYFGDKSGSTLPTESPNPTAVFRSRTLLSVDDNTDYVYHDNELNTSYHSIPNENYLNELSTTAESAKVLFGNIGNYLEREFVLKTNISMILQQNFSWPSLLNDEHADVKS